MLLTFFFSLRCVVYSQNDETSRNHFLTCRKYQRNKQNNISWTYIIVQNPFSETLIVKCGVKLDKVELTVLLNFHHSTTVRIIFIQYKVNNIIHTCTSPSSPSPPTVFPVSLFRISELAPKTLTF